MNANWRLLEPGEIVEAGDEIYTHHEWKFTETWWKEVEPAMVGTSVSSTWAPVRRKNNWYSSAPLAEQPKDFAKIVDAWKAGAQVQYFVLNANDSDWTTYSATKSPPEQPGRLAWRVAPNKPAPQAEQPAQHRSTGWVSHRDQYAVPVLFNPYTGEPRDVRDVQSDPQGILIVPPGKTEMLAATQQPAQPQQEPVYAFRRKGQDSFVPCDKERYEELAGKPNLFQVTTFYVAPPQRQPLTDEQIMEASLQAGMQEHYMGFHSGFIRFARAIEAAHGLKEKNA